MPSERVQRQIDRFLDQAEEAMGRFDWPAVQECARAVLGLDTDNSDARAFLEAANHNLNAGSTAAGEGATAAAKPSSSSTSAQPTSFANGRYTVSKFLGEGGKKKVYLARDSLLDRDVAFALIKTEGLDEASRVRVQREAQAMGRLGAHPHIVTVFDIGEENGQPYLVLPVLGGGDVEGVIEKAPENKLTIERAVKIALDTCLGLEFAHSKGIVHRDLKPGNVWLTDDGRAMIGDFGLAVAVDKSRLTQAGMMVGTVSYMPPEQAMGGEVGPRSDLYSLGAMLYEMVCGRPPFVGDESVAIIGQHLNTPPVAPSWHRPDCPSGLEALILRLLEKDPSKRPASATEVREALEAINVAAPIAGARDTSVVQDAPSGDNPLYRRTFVGREVELKQVQQAFDAALSGQGGLVMVVGEPGIGKTALCEQLATYVALRGGRALVGHCYEEGSLSLPYLAFVEAMRSYVLAREPDGLRSDLGTGAADVARIVSEVRDRVQGVELRPAGDPEDDRWRLLQAVTSFLRNASTVQPLMIVLEDLHWADRGTLDLLLHASRNLQGARLLIVGTYRDVEVDRSHPLSATVADLRRSGSFLRVPLRGLTVDEVHRMYESLRGNDVPWAQAETVHRQTEGNPLFVQEVLRYLVEEGVVVREDGRYVARDAGAAVPEGLRDVIGRRLSHLDERTNTVLSVASVIGRDFRLEVLQSVVGLGEDDLYAALEEVSSRAIVEQLTTPSGVAFRFTHAMFRTLLYDEIFAPRRIRLHQQVGRALEEVHARRLEEHASELAEHFSQSTEAADLEKAVRYGELAAARASSVFAYSEAVRHLEQALRAQEVLDPDNSVKRCDLLLALCDSQLPVGAPTRVLDVLAEEAFVLAEALGDTRRAARACRIGLEALGRIAPSAAIVGTPRAQPWLQRADSVAAPNTGLRALTDMWLSLRMLVRSQPGAREAVMAAYDLARAAGDLDVQFQTAASALIMNGRPENLPSVQPIALEMMDKPRIGVGARALSLFLQFAAVALLHEGDRKFWERACDELNELADRTHDGNVIMSARHMVITRLLLDGRLTEAVEMAAATVSLGRELGVYSTIALFVGVQAASYLGEAARLLESMPDADPDSVLMRHAGLEEFSEAELTRSRVLLDARLAAIPFEQIQAVPFAAVLSASQALMDDELAKNIVAMASGTMAGPTGLSLQRIVSQAALFVGDRELAKSKAQDAVWFNEKIGNRPDLALSHLQLAALLLEHYPDEHDAAIEYLDLAIAKLRDMKMQPALERALRHRGLLKA